MDALRLFNRFWKNGLPLCVGFIVFGFVIQSLPSAAETPSPSRSDTKTYFEIPGTEDVAVFDFKSRRIIRRISLDSAAPAPDETRRESAPPSDRRYIYWARHHTDDLSVIDTETYRVIERIPLNEKGPGNVTVAEDRHALYIPHYQAKALTIFDLREKKQRVISLDGFPGDVAVTPQGTILVTSRDSNQVLAVDEATGHIQTVEVGRNPVGVAVVADGSRAYVSHDTENTVAVIDLTAVPLRVVKRVRVGAAGGSAVSAGPDGKHVYVAHCCANSSVTVISVETMDVRCELMLGPKGLDPVRIVFSPAGDEAFIINSGSTNISSFRPPCGRPVAENLFE